MLLTLLIPHFYKSLTYSILHLLHFSLCQIPYIVYTYHLVELYLLTLASPHYCNFRLLYVSLCLSLILFKPLTTFAKNWPQLYLNFLLIGELRYRNFFRKIPQPYCAFGSEGTYRPPISTIFLLPYKRILISGTVFLLICLTTLC